MRLPSTGSFVNTDHRATSAGGIGWRLGREAGAARRDGRESRGGLFTDAGSANAKRLDDVLLEPTGTQTPATATTSPSPASLCSNLWPITADWAPGESLNADALRRPVAPRGSHRRWSQLDQNGTSTTLPTGNLHSGLGSPLARGQSCHASCRTS